MLDAYEMAIVNLDSYTGSGSHWVCYKKKGANVDYFDSFGNLRPPIELIRYFGESVCVRYNYPSFQNLNSVICGHLCLLFLQS